MFSYMQSKEHAPLAEKLTSALLQFTSVYGGSLNRMKYEYCKGSKLLTRGLRCKQLRSVSGVHAPTGQGCLGRKRGTYTILGEFYLTAEDCTRRK